jgi:hypothetical protein
LLQDLDGVIHLIDLVNKAAWRNKHG